MLPTEEPWNAAEFRAEEAWRAREGEEPLTLPVLGKCKISAKKPTKPDAAQKAASVSEGSVPGAGVGQKSPSEGLASAPPLKKGKGSRSETRTWKPKWLGYLPFWSWIGSLSLLLLIIR